MALQDYNSCAISSVNQCWNILMLKETSAFIEMIKNNALKLTKITKALAEVTLAPKQLSLQVTL